MTPFFQRGISLFAGCIFAAVLLVAVYWVLVHFYHPASYSGPVQAVLSTGRPFEHSSSVLLADLSWIFALVEGLTYFCISELFFQLYTASVVVEVTVGAAAVYSMA